jgi:uncharacterized protein involved in outer membrane biogenesis
MKWIIKWVFRLLVLLVVMAVVLVLSLDAIVKAALEQQIRAATGMETEIGSLDVGLISPVLSIEDFKVYNSAEYGGMPFVDMPELYLEYDRMALLKRKLHVTLMRLNLAEVNVVRSETGKTNVVNGVPPLPKKQRSELSKWFGGIDVLNLSLGKVKYVDLKNPQANLEKRLDVKDQVFKNVETLDDLKAVMLLVWLRSNGGVLGASSGIAPIPAVLASPVGR